MPKVTLVLKRTGVAVTSLALELNESKLAEAVVAALGTDLEALQARWSGPAICINLGGAFVVPDDKGEDGKTDVFGLGTVAFSPRYNELVIAYGAVEFYDDTAKEPSSCYIIGKVAESDQQTLQALGESIHRDGFRDAKVTTTPPG